MFWRKNRFLELTSTVNSQCIAIEKKRISIVFQIPDQVQDLNGKDILIPGYCNITMSYGMFYSVRESYDFIMGRLKR